MEDVAEEEEASVLKTACTYKERWGGGVRDGKLEGRVALSHDERSS